MLKTEDNYRNYLYVIEGAIYHTEVAQPQVNLDITIAQLERGSPRVGQSTVTAVNGSCKTTKLMVRVYDRGKEAEQKHVKIMEDRRYKVQAEYHVLKSQPEGSLSESNTIEDHIMDSGASFRATYCKEELERFKLRSGKVCLADGKTLDIASVGDVVLKTSFDVSFQRQRSRYMEGRYLLLQARWFGEVEEGFLHNVRKTRKLQRIVMLKMVPETPIQFGIAERLSRTFRAESTGLRAEAPKMLWADSVSTAYLIYRIPYVLIGLRILEEEWRGKDTGLAHLKVFGCDSFVKVKDVYGEAMKCTFIGNGSDEMRYSFWDTKSHQIRVRGPKTMEASRIVEDQMKKTLKMEHPPRREAPRLHMYECPPDSPGLQDVHQVGDEREVKVLCSFNWPTVKLITRMVSTKSDDYFPVYYGVRAIYRTEVDSKNLLDRVFQLNLLVLITGTSQSRQTRSPTKSLLMLALRQDSIFTVRNYFKVSLEVLGKISRIMRSGYQQKDKKPSQNDKTEHGMEKTVQNQGQSPKMPKSESILKNQQSNRSRN
ncbi:hypothetical protein Tco_1181946 [Tanacetum coccineum]